MYYRASSSLVLQLCDSKLYLLLLSILGNLELSIPNNVCLSSLGLLWHHLFNVFWASQIIFGCHQVFPKTMVGGGGLNHEFPCQVCNTVLHKRLVDNRNLAAASCNKASSFIISYSIFLGRTQYFCGISGSPLSNMATY